MAWYTYGIYIYNRSKFIFLKHILIYMTKLKNTGLVPDGPQQLPCWSGEPWLLEMAGALCLVCGVKQVFWKSVRGELVIWFVKCECEWSSQFIYRWDCWKLCWWILWLKPLECEHICIELWNHIMSCWILFCGSSHACHAMAIGLGKHHVAARRLSQIQQT